MICIAWNIFSIAVSIEKSQWSLFNILVIFYKPLDTKTIKNQSNGLGHCIFDHSSILLTKNALDDYCIPKNIAHGEGKDILINMYSKTVIRTD